MGIKTSSTKDTSCKCTIWINKHYSGRGIINTFTDKKRVQNVGGQTLFECWKCHIHDTGYMIYHLITGST